MIFRSGLRASDIRLRVQPLAHFSPWIISAMWIFSLPEVSHSVLSDMGYHVYIYIYTMYKYIYIDIPLKLAVFLVTER